MNVRTARGIAISLFVIGAVFVGVQATLLLQGQTRNSALCGIVGSVIVIIGALLTMYVNGQTRDGRK